MPRTKPLRFVTATLTLTPNSYFLCAFAFGKAFDLGRVQGIELAGVVPLLGEQPIDQGEGAGKVRCQRRVAGELAPDVACHPAEKGLEPLDLALGAVVLAGMQIGARLAQHPLAEAGGDLVAREGPLCG